jgi:hypothetical protein
MFLGGDSRFKVLPKTPYFFGLLPIFEGGRRTSPTLDRFGEGPVPPAPLKSIYDLKQIYQSISEMGNSDEPQKLATNSGEL